MRRLTMNAMIKKIKIFDPHSQQGAALIIAVLILLVLTVVGIFAVTTSTLDTKITGYHKWHVEAFYAADAGLDFAAATCPFGTMEDVGDTWPSSDYASPYDSAPYHHTDPEFDINMVQYRGATLPPVGSGTGQRAGFMAHHYRTVSDGEDQAGVSSSTVNMWGYRIGF
jgi:hypothetical protein